MRRPAHRAHHAHPRASAAAASHPHLLARGTRFHKSARDTRRMMCKQNLKMNLIIALAVVVCLLIIIIPIVTSVSRHHPP